MGFVCGGGGMTAAGSGAKPLSPIPSVASNMVVATTPTNSVRRKIIRHRRCVKKRIIIQLTPSSLVSFLWLSYQDDLT